MDAKNDVCPNCGYCPHCGRGGHQMQPTWPYPTYPWYPTGPIWISPSWWGTGQITTPTWTGITTYDTVPMAGGTTTCIGDNITLTN